MKPPLFKKFISIALSGAILFPSFPSSVFAGKIAAGTEAAAPSESETETALRFMKGLGVYKDGDAVGLSYLAYNGRLTPLGEVLYRYLKAQPSPQDEMEGVEEQMKRLRDSGPYSSKKGEAVDAALRSYQEKFSSLDGEDGSAEGTFRLGTLREAMMTGAAAVDPPKKNYVQVEIEDGWEFWDKEGLAFRLNKHQVTTYNRELQKSQRAMNISRPAKAPFIPETGRYSHEMIQYSYWRLKSQHEELDKAYHIDRMINMAELLGKQYKDDMWFTNLSLEGDLERWAKAKTYTHHGQTYSVYDIVEKKMKGRTTYLGLAAAGLQRFEGEMDKLKGITSISEARIGTMQLHEQHVMRLLSLTFLETQMFHTKNQLERLDPKSPDSKALLEAIKDSPLDPVTKEKLQREQAKLYARTEGIKKRLLQVQQVLVKSDYAGNLDVAQAALNSAQKELTELGLDYTLFAEIPAAAQMSRVQTGRGMGGWAVKAWWKVRIDGEHSRNMDEVAKMLERYPEVAKLLAAGDYWGARKAVVAMHPEAIKTKREIGFGGSAKVTEALRVSASLKQSRDLLGSVEKVNTVVETIGNYISWTVSLALAAPLASGVLSGVARLAAGPAKIPVLGLPFRVVEEVALHTSARLNSLNPAAQNIKTANVVGRYLAYSGVRLVNAGARQGTFTLLSGGISGAFTVGGHLWDQYVPEFDLWIVSNDKDHTTFDSSWEAAGVGFKGGVVWANESFHPALGYVGLPSTIFEGTPLAGAARTLGERGVMGTVGEMAKKVGIPISERFSLQALGAKWGGAGQIAAFPLGMADNVAKYALFSQAVGKAAEWRAWRGGVDIEDVERRIKVAQREGMKWMDSPAWLLIPVFPAKYEEAAAEFMRADQGKKIYDQKGLRAKYANASENQELPMLGKVEVPVMQKIFNMRWLGEVQENATWRVTKEVKRQGIAEELMEAVQGGRKGAKASDLNPMEFYRVTQLGDKDMIGNLHLSDEVRLQAREKFGEALKAREGLTEKVLNAEPGAKVAGFGRVTPGVQKEVALTIHLEAAKGAKVPKVVTARAAKILEPYLKADELVKPASKKLMEAVRSVRGESPKMDAAVEDMLSALREWMEGQSVPGNKWQGKSYMDLVADLKLRTEKNGELAPKEKAVMKGIYEYVDAIEARFNYFNKVDMAHQLSAETLKAMRVEHAENQNAAKLLDGFSKKLEAWKATQKGTDPAVGPNHRTFSDMLTSMSGELRQLKASRGISSATADAIKAGIKEMEAAPWVLHDSKGSALPSWRPEQFEGLMISLGLVAMMGKGGGPVREFLMLKTGGGKTMLTFEGLLPLVEADAAHHGMEVTFLTVQSNLEAQARLEFLAFKKISSKLNFMTYEEFKAKIAEGKLEGKNLVKKHWIFGDEGDGAALQPMLTIGEVTARISKANSAYKIIQRLGEMMEARLGKSSVELAEGVRAEAQRAKSAAEALDPASPQGQAARRTADALLKAADQLSMARHPEARLAVDAKLRTLAAELQKAADAGPLAAPPKELAKLGKLSEQLAGMADKLESAKSPAQMKKAVARIESLLKEQMSLLDSAGLGEGVAGGTMRSGAESLRARLRNAADAGLEGKGAELAKQVRTAADSQKEAMSGTSRPGPEQTRLVREAGERLIEKLDSWTPSSAGERSQIMGEMARALIQQQNLLGLNKQGATARAEELRVQAAERYSRAEEKISRLTKELEKTESAQGRAQGKASQTLAARSKEIRLALEAAKAESAAARRFASSSKELAEAREGAAELRQAAKRRIEVLDKELRSVREEIETARKGGKPADALETKVKAYELELAAAQKDLATAGKADRASPRDAAHAKALFEADAKDILKLVEEGAPGWEAKALDRLKLRAQYLETFGYAENPVYGVYRDIKNDMYSFANSSERLYGDEATAKKTVETLLRRIEGEPSLLKLGLIWSGRTAKNLALKAVGQSGGPSVKVDEVGLVRVRAWTLLKSLMTDPVLPPGQKYELFWSVLPSVLWPEGPMPRAMRSMLHKRFPGMVAEKGSSWVRNEYMNMGRAYFDNPANVRLDNLSKNVNVIHNGQWFDSMDTPTRRFWELEYGTDLTLPYKHRTVSTIKDITEFKKSRFILLSGTLGNELRRDITKPGAGVRVGVVGSSPPDNVRLDVRAGAAEKFASIKEAVLRARAVSQGLTVVKPLAPDLPPEVAAYFKTLGIGKKESAVVKVSDAPAGKVRAFLEGQKALQGQSGLTVLSLSDTRILREVRNYLIKTGMVKADEIAMVFSDAEWLRLNRPEARVGEQMNLSALNNGKVKILMLDTRVGGRGLDLNFKGDRDNPDPAAFKGYTNFEMLIVDPHEMSKVHLLQAEGRIDTGRVLPGAGGHRSFALVLDVGAAQKDVIFKTMFDGDPLFASLRKDPEVLAFAKAKGKTVVDWVTIHEFMARAESQKLRLEQVESYKKVVENTLDKKQAEVEKDQLRSANVIQDRPLFDPRFRGLDATGH